MKKPLNKIEKDRMIVLFISFLLVIVFWGAFEQAGGLMNIYAKENSLNTCLILNTNKHVVEALNANIFVVKDAIIKTPPILDGCLKGVMRKQILELLPSLDGYTVEETSISPFELQKADEIFLTNVIAGIQPITKYRKKTYTNEVSRKLIQKLNIKIRLG